MRGSDERYAAALLIVTILFLGAVSAVAVANRELLAADGALFTFVAGLSNPWIYFWSDFRPRAGAFVLAYAAPQIAVHLFGSQGPAAFLLYQVSWFGLPVAGLIVSWFALPAYARTLIAAPAVTTLALVMTTFGFPSETTVLVSLVWPTLFLLRFRRSGVAHAVIRLVFVTLTFFSHPGMVFTVPPLAYAWLRGVFERDDRGSPRAAMVEAAIIAPALAASLAMIVYFVPANALTARALQSNETHFFSMRFADDWRVLAGFLACAAFAAASALNGSRGRNVLAAVLGAAVAALLVADVMSDRSAYVHSYLARSAVAFACPVMLVLTLILLEWRNTIPITPASIIVLCLIAGHAVQQVRTQTDWRHFRLSLTAAVADNVTDTAILQQRMTAEAGSRLYGRFAWSWVPPYQTILIRRANSIDGPLLNNPTNWYAPMRCDTARKMSGEVALKGLPVATADLVRLTCALQGE